MRKQPIHVLLLAGLAAFGAVGCSGGGSTGTVSLKCNGGAAFCVSSCDLGCGQSGCAITEIAENQTLAFTFNKPVDRTSVNTTTFAIRTVSGQSPEGDFLVDGNVVRFKPRVRFSGTQITFGFVRNETYVMTMLGGSQGMRSINGDRLSADYTCSVVVSRGVIDEDGAPPTAELISPTQTSNVPVDVTIVLRFSELIDVLPFLGGSLTSPVYYKLKRARTNANNEIECDPQAQELQLEGATRVSVEQYNGRDVVVVSMRPSTALPGGCCVVIYVTNAVRDLAGIGAVDSQFQFTTIPSPPVDIEMVENFASPARLDVQISGGTWSNGAVPGLIGGDGRHGTFNIANGTPAGNQIYVWNTNNMTIPGTQTLNGQPYPVQDGKFYFTDLTIPAGYTLRFEGDNVPQIYVRGRAEVHGRIELNARNATTFTCRGSTSAPIPGQAGFTGGPGGARGGKGGDRCLNGGPNPINNGENGLDLRLQAGHAYAAQAIGTGGRGSAMFPATGLNSSWAVGLSGAFSGQIAPGGSGGGFTIPGTIATVGPGPAGSTIQVGTNPGPSNAFNLFPVPSPTPSSLAHFLVGGSGGGGGASHMFLSTNPTGTQDIWKAGAAGTGGGGSMALRAGNDLIISSTAVLEARGGNGVTYSLYGSEGIPSPGGAGSGGSLLLQSGAVLTVAGAIDTSGGTGSRANNIQPSIFNVPNLAGNGSPGMYRLEAPTRNIALLSAVPALTPNFEANLTDRDDLSGCTSLWRSTGQVFPPEWRFYVLEVDTDGDSVADVTFSDDPNQGLPANNPIGPVTIKFQGARVSSTGVPENGTVGPWVNYINSNAGASINAVGATGFRFMMTYNRGAFPQVKVLRLAVTYRL